MGNTARVLTGDDRARKRGAKAAGGDTPRPVTAPAVDLYSAHETGPSTLLFYSVVAAFLVTGFLVRGREYLVAEEGLGYYLGIVGGSAMLLLLLYPLRKKLKSMRSLGASKHWFRAHMILGILGPALVLYHSNFRFGSTNSTVALACTLVVAGSGLVGRHFYNKIHFGLFGRKMSMKELKSQLVSRQNDFATVLGYAPRLGKRLMAFDDWALRESNGFIHSLARFLLTGFRAAWTNLTVRLALRRVIKVTARRNGWTRREVRFRKRIAKNHIREHISNAVMIAEFSIYERLFSLWHLFHMPLFILLIGVAVLHVVAVHMY